MALFFLLGSGERKRKKGRDGIGPEDKLRVKVAAMLASGAEPTQIQPEVKEGWDF